MTSRIHQQYTSADTSINNTKLPAIYKYIKGKIDPTQSVIDYGCGKFFDNYNLPENYVGYDPFNRPDEEALNSTYDVALCSNVLNVIAEREVRIELLRTLKRLANRVLITVYEGNKSGKGCVTKKDCYQLNRKRKDYMDELAEVWGDDVKYKRGCFECGEMVI